MSALTHPALPYEIKVGFAAGDYILASTTTEEYLFNQWGISGELWADLILSGWYKGTYEYPITSSLYGFNQTKHRRQFALWCVFNNYTVDYNGT